MTPEFGAATQLEKIDMLDFADVVALNKFDKRGSLDAIRDVKKQYRRNHNLWDAKDEDIPVYGTIASQFNDPGMNNLYKHLIDLINKSSKTDFSSSFKSNKELSEKVFIIPPNRVRYLSEIAENNREFDKRLNQQVLLADKLYVFCKALKELSRDNNNTVKSILEEKIEQVKLDFDARNQKTIDEWDSFYQSYNEEFFKFNVRDKELKIATSSKSLSNSKIPKVALPKFTSWGDIIRWVQSRKCSW
jgi:methylmalonyl-CoA mutase